MAELRPIEASALPVSDKPVTLSFKGGLSTKASSSSVSGLGSAKKAAPLSLGFSMTEDDGNDGNGEDDKGGSDPSKGLSHLRCKRAVFWICLIDIYHNTQLWP